jgi:cell division protein FtsB
MTTASAQTTQQRSRTAESLEPRGARFAVRRRILIVVVLCALVTLAVAANYGPLKHYLDAIDRLETRTAEVAALETHNAQLQTQLSKLLQPGHLEELARQELTYTLPDEELYIVTDIAPATTGAAGADGMGVGAVVASADGSAASGGRTHEPGFIERLLSRIGDLF